MTTISFRNIRPANHGTNTTPVAPLATQQFRALHSPYKDSQERDSLKPRRNEGTATGSDDEVASLEEAWDKARTRPEEELEESRRKGGWSVLDGSGGNQEFSKPQGDSPSENRGGEKSGKKTKSTEAKAKKHGLLKPKA